MPDLSAPAAKAGIEAAGRTRVLIVEDEKKVANALREGLEDEGYQVVVEHSGEGAIARVGAEPFDVALVDLMLPGVDGLHVVSKLRGSGHDTRVLVLTARDTVEDRVQGLDAGADDYLIKPFAFAEVLARIRALLRRGKKADAARLDLGDLHVDLVARTVTRSGRPIELTLRELELLECLLRHAGQVVSRETLAHDVWYETARSTTLDNVMDVHIARLRRKIDLDQPVRLIHTVRGVGFVMREEEA